MEYNYTEMNTNIDDQNLQLQAQQDPALLLQELMSKLDLDEEKQPGRESMQLVHIAAANVDRNLINVIQQLIMVMPHVQNCQARVEGQLLQCSFPNCEATRNFMRHMNSCQTTKPCSVHLCYSFRKIFLHMEQCMHEKCGLCALLRVTCLVEMTVPS